MNRIVIRRGDTGKIAARVGVTPQSVRAALRFATEGERPDRIREVALREYGGQLVRFPRKLPQ